MIMYRIIFFQYSDTYTINSFNSIDSIKLLQTIPNFQMTGEALGTQNINYTFSILSFRMSYYSLSSLWTLVDLP